MVRNLIVAALVLAASDLVAACGPTAVSQSTYSARTGSVSWSPCQASQGPAGVECSALEVPLSATASEGRMIALALDRIPARKKRLGYLVLNPGGPGVSAVDELPGLASELSPAVRDHFDLIGYDPPGVGHSTPVECFDNVGLGRYLHTDPSPPGPAGFSTIAAAARSFVAACEEHSGYLLGHVSTLDAARDLDRVRASLDAPTLNYLGFSYGTLLGATYATLFPDRVRAMVLDGAIDPTLPPLASLESQAAAVDAQFVTFSMNCSHTKSCPYHPGRDPDATFESLLARVRATPVPVGNRQVGPAELLYGAAAALYSTSQWPTLSQALADLDRGDGTAILALFDSYVGRSSSGVYDTTSESEQAVNCADAAAPTLGEIATAAEAVKAEAPLFGPLDVDGEVVCALWPAQAEAKSASIGARTSTPIVVVGSTGDPITPYPWSVSLTKQLGSAVLLTRVGNGHTAYGASSCVRSHLDPYFLSLQPPPSSIRCPSS